MRVHVALMLFGTVRHPCGGDDHPSFCTFIVYCRCWVLDVVQVSSILQRSYSWVLKLHAAAPKNAQIQFVPQRQCSIALCDSCGMWRNISSCEESTISVLRSPEECTVSYLGGYVAHKLSKYAVQCGPIKTVHFEIPFFLQLRTDFQHSFTRWFVRKFSMYTSHRITFKLATLVFRCLHGLAPAYLAEAFNRAADIESRCRLRFGSSSALLVPTTRRRTLGDRAFAVAGARVWNSLLATLTSQPSLLMFRRQLKTLLFEQSFSWLFFFFRTVRRDVFAALFFCDCYVSLQFYD